MRKLAARLSLALALAASSPLVGAAADQESAPIRQVFLVQNSGWMEPFFKDPKSQFKLLVSSLIAQSNLRGVPVTVAAFNQNGETGAPSPQVLYAGPYEKDAVQRAVSSIELAKKPSGAYADADFFGTLQSAIAQLLGGREGIIWMLSNNKDSPNNSQTVVENTHKFYALLRNSPYITRIAAFPVRDDLSGPNFHEKGCIVYAFAYGQAAGRALDVVLRDGSPARALFRSPPVRIKPLDRDPVELRLTQAQTGPVQARVRDGALELTHVQGGKPFRIVLTGVLRNTYYPQNIDSARLDAAWSSSDPAIRAGIVSLSPTSIENVAAQSDSQPITIVLQGPAVPRTGALFGLLDNSRSVRGELQIRLQDMRFSLAPDFVERISALSGADVIGADQGRLITSDQLPEVFFDYRKISSATTVVPVAMQVEHSPLPLIFSLVLLTAVVGGGTFLLLWSARGRTYLVAVGGGQQQVTLRPFEHRVVSDAFGTRATVTGALFGAPHVRTVGEDQKTQH